jgi:hypothetical protein
MIQLCSSIVEFNKILKEKGFLIYSLKSSNIVSRINPFNIGKKYIEIYSNEIKEKTKVWIQTAISIDQVGL